MTSLEPVVAAHGGAGDVDPARRPEHVAGCRTAAEAGLAVLLAGATVLDAVQAAVESMEDNPLFNAGTGASLTEDGELELDASVMEGTSLRAGAVAALPPFEHPIRIARAALEDARHILYAGAGAAAFARTAGFCPARPETMVTEAAVERLRRFREGQVGAGWAGGTVGAVACDSRGRVAAATSTGGTVGKRSGRVGDTPIIGAGTYADDDGGACSATGIGEAIMRACLARACVDLMRAGLPAGEAARAALEVLGRRFGGKGGLVAIDPGGRVAALWNTTTMSHAVARPSGTDAGS